jgi:hypothetical protein
MDAVAKKQHDGRKVKVLALQELVGKVLGSIENVTINLSKTKEAGELWVGLLERAVLELAEIKDWTSRAESDAAILRTAIPDGSAKVEGVQ